MVINYCFNGSCFDYEISYKEYRESLVSILGDLEKEDIINLLILADNCLCDLKTSFAEELKEFFKDKAHKEYLSRRYE